MLFSPGAGRAIEYPGAQAITMSTRKTVAVENTAQAFLEMLEALGVRYLIGNAGHGFRLDHRRVFPNASLTARPRCAR